MCLKKCFLCTGEIHNGISESENSSTEESSFLLCKILELPDLGENGTEIFGGRKISYCRLCLNKILNIRDMLEELERLEKKVLDEKYSIELQLKDKEKSRGQNSSDELRGQIVSELQAASIGSMLDKIRRKRVGQRRKGSRHIRILKNVTIPNIVSETIQPISQDQLQAGSVLLTSQESEPQLVRQHLFLSNPQSSFMRNSHMEIQEENMTSDEPLASSADMTETSWTSDDEELDLKYEIRSDSEIITDPLQPDLDQFDFPQQNLIGRSTKLEVDLPDVTKFSDAQQTTTEDPRSHKNFICGTCGAAFLSYNLLRIHDRRHLKGGNCSSSRVKIIRRTKIKSGLNIRDLKPSMRPKKCEECEKVLSSHQTWTDHVMSVHRGEYKYKCTLCNQGYQKPAHLRVHMKNAHSVDVAEDLNMECSKCGRVCKTRQGLVVHMSKCSVVQQ